RFQPRASHPATQSRMPCTRYCESETYTTPACFHWRRIHSSVAIAPARAIRLLVVWGEHSYKSHRATLSPAGASISAALPPGLGLELSFPRQLSSAWTSTRGACSTPRARGMSGLDDHREIGVLQDFLRVGYHHGTGPARDLTHVRAGEQRVAAGLLDHSGHDLAQLPGLDVRHERHPLHRQGRLGNAHHLESRLAVRVRVDDMDRPPGHRRELHGQLERPAAR